MDIWVGLSAPLVSWAATRARGGQRLALAWNIVGLLALANVVTRALLTAPGPLHLLVTDVPNLAIGSIPYVFVPGLFVLLAVSLHVLAMRRIVHAAQH